MENLKFEKEHSWKIRSRIGNKNKKINFYFQKLIEFFYFGKQNVDKIYADGVYADG